MAIFDNEKDFLEIEQKIFQESGRHISKNDPIFMSLLITKYTQDKFVENFSKNVIELTSEQIGKEKQIIEHLNGTLNTLLVENQRKIEDKTDKLEDDFNNLLDKFYVDIETKKIEFKDHFDQLVNNLKNQLSDVSQDKFGNIEVWKINAMEQYTLAIKNQFESEVVKEIFDKHSKELVEQIKKSFSDLGKGMENMLNQSEKQIIKNSRIIEDKSGVMAEFAVNFNEFSSTVMKAQKILSENLNSTKESMQKSKLIINVSFVLFALNFLMFLIYLIKG